MNTTLKVKKVTKKSLWNAVVSLSSPSKMPCHGYSTPAKKCQIGSKLRKVVNSVCSTCYACKGNYQFPAIQTCLEDRFNVMQNDPAWSDNMIALLNMIGDDYFRWFDSGDIQSVDDLVKIVKVCKGTPPVSHWLPTREYGYVSEYVKQYGAFPENLTVRLSAYMKDVPGPKTVADRLNVLTSSVSSKGDHNCPASTQNNACGDCRKCWNKNVSEIVYKKH